VTTDKVLGRLVVVAMLSVFLSGCNRPDTDVTASPEYNFSSFAGTVWKTKVKVALVDIKSYKGDHLMTLVAPESFDPTHPRYRPPPYMERIIAVLPVGTRVRIERLMKDNGNWGGVRVTASLEDGRVVYVLWELLAKNRFIAEGWSESKSWGVDSGMLEK
jgi:hypothetical protein